MPVGFAAASLVLTLLVGSSPFGSGRPLRDHEPNKAPSPRPAERNVQRRTVPRHVGDDNDHSGDRECAKPGHGEIL